MQSTKEEHREILEGGNEAEFIHPESFQGHTGTEKCLIVLLVATATVSLLTNLLVLGILSRNPKVTFKYQLLKSQAIVGLLACAIAVYPLKMLCLVLLDPSHARSRLGESDSQFFASRFNCLSLCYIPVSAVILLQLSHSLLLFYDQVITVVALKSRSLLLLAVSNRRTRRALLLSLWILPISFSLAQISAAEWKGFCYRIWSQVYFRVYCGAVGAYGIIFLILSGISAFFRRKTSSLGQDCEESDDLKRLCSGNKPRKVRKTMTTSLGVRMTLSRISILNFILSFLSSIPVLIINSPGQGSYQSVDSLLDEAENSDQALAWSHFLVLTLSAFSPFLAVLADEVVSGLGLEIFHALVHYGSRDENKVIAGLDSFTAGGKHFLEELRRKRRKRKNEDGSENFALKESSVLV